MSRTNFAALAWPEARLSDAVAALIYEVGGGATANNLDAACVSIERLAAHLGHEAEPVESTFGDLAERLTAAVPGWIRLPSGEYLALVSANRRSMRVLTPDLVKRTVPLAAVCDEIRGPAEARRRPEIEELLASAGLTGPRFARAADTLLREQLATSRFRDLWSVRLPPGAPLFPWLGQVGAIGNASALVIAYAAQYLLWVAGFWIVGQGALKGRIERGWLLAWALVLATLIPFRLLATWYQGLIAISVGGLLKQRLLAGALKLLPDEMRKDGIGRLLGKALEAETVESFALNGGIAGVLAAIELVVAGAILGRLGLLLLIWAAITVALAWRFLKRYRQWTSTRVAMTHELVEAMSGHRTRLAQQAREDWHTGEDCAMESYFGLSKIVDTTGAWLIAVAPRGWLLVILAALAPGFVSSSMTGVQLAIALGGALLAFNALKRLTGSLTDIAAAWVAWGQVKPLFLAAARPEQQGALADPGSGAGATLEAESIVFRYRERGSAVLDGCSLRLEGGERILMEGRSGGGKSTLASILAGLRQPESGLLLSGGVDFRTLGLNRWRKRIATAPQFHENHVLTETLAFNLLMGKRWPPTQDDLQEAAGLCVQLGLGGLLERMPGGILQMVGEGGWQLSHGERSRVFLARALLQGSGTVILDESFAALDPETLRVAMECALDRAGSLIVIAHP